MGYKGNNFPLKNIDILPYQLPQPHYPRMRTSRCRQRASYRCYVFLLAKTNAVNVIILLVFKNLETNKEPVTSERVRTAQHSQRMCKHCVTLVQISSRRTNPILGRTSVPYLLDQRNRCNTYNIYVVQ